MMMTGGRSSTRAFRPHAAATMRATASSMLRVRERVRDMGTGTRKKRRSAVDGGPSVYSWISEFQARPETKHARAHEGRDVVVQRAGTVGAHVQQCVAIEHRVVIENVKGIQ